MSLEASRLRNRGITNVSHAAISALRDRQTDRQTGRQAERERERERERELHPRFHLRQARSGS